MSDVDDVLRAVMGQADEIRDNGDGTYTYVFREQVGHRTRVLHVTDPRRLLEHTDPLLAVLLRPNVLRAIADVLKGGDL